MNKVSHIGIGAQSTLGGHKIFARKICIKNQQNARILHDSCRKNYQNTRIIMIFAPKNYKIPEFYMIFCAKMPEFYIIIARKIFFPNFTGARAPTPPVSYAYGFSSIGNQQQPISVAYTILGLLIWRTNPPKLTGVLP